MQGGIETWRIQVFALFGVMLFIGIVVHLIKGRHLREEYSLVWLGAAFVLMVVSAWRESLVILSRFLGVVYAPAVLFILVLGAIIVLLLHFSVILSSHKERIKVLAHEVAFLREEISRVADISNRVDQPEKDDVNS